MSNTNDKSAKASGKPGVSLVRTPNDPTMQARMAIASAAQSTTPGHIHLPEDISPYAGLDPELAQALQESFPAPNPDIVRARRLRAAAGANDRGYYSVILGIPSDVLFVTGMRIGDTVLISGWAQGVIRLIRVPEGPSDSEQAGE